MRIIFIFLVLLSTQKGLGQTTDWIVQGNGAANSGIVGFNDLVVDSIGNSYSLISVNGNSITLNSQVFSFPAGGGFLFVKNDSLGVIEWVKVIHGNRRRTYFVNDVYLGDVQICLDPNGNPIVAGSFGKYYGSPMPPDLKVFVDTVELTNEDFFISKWTPSGNLIWIKSGVGHENIRGLCTDSQGSSYVSMTAKPTTWGGVIIESDTIGFVSSIQNTYLLIKFDSNGNIIWNLKDSTPFANNLAQNVEEEDGFLYFTGYYYKQSNSNNAVVGLGTFYFSDPPPPSGYTNFYLTKINKTTSEVLWAKKMQLPSGFRLQVFRSRIYLSPLGISVPPPISVKYDTVTFTLDPLKKDIVLIVDTSGQYLKHTTSGGNNLKGTYNLVFLNNGGYWSVFPEGSGSLGGINYTPNGSLLLKIDSMLDNIQPFGFYTAGNRFAITSNPETVYWFGSVGSAGNINGTSLTAHSSGAFDFVIARLTDLDSLTIGTNSKLADKPRIEVYPNPGAGLFTIELPKGVESNRCHFMVYNENGQYIKHLLPTKNVSNVQVDLSDFSIGSYIIVVQYGKTQFSSKILKN